MKWTYSTKAYSSQYILLNMTNCFCPIAHAKALTWFLPRVNPDFSLLKDSTSRMNPTWDTTGCFPSTLVHEQIRPLKIGTILKGNESFCNHQCSEDMLVFGRVVHKENKVAFNVGMKWWRRTGTQGRCLVLKRKQEPSFVCFASKQTEYLIFVYAKNNFFLLFYLYILSKFWRQLQYIIIYVYIYIDRNMYIYHMRGLNIPPPPPPPPPLLLLLLLLLGILGPNCDSGNCQVGS